PAAEGRHPARVTTAAGPRDEVRATFVEHALAVPLRDDRRADASTALPYDPERVPRIRVLDIGDASIDLADGCRPVEGDPDEPVHRAGGIDVAHPVIPIRMDPESREEVDEDLGVVPGV